MLLMNIYMYTCFEISHLKEDNYVKEFNYYFKTLMNFRLV